MGDGRVSSGETAGPKVSTVCPPSSLEDHPEALRCPPAELALEVVVPFCVSHDTVTVRVHGANRGPWKPCGIRAEAENLTLRKLYFQQPHNLGKSGCCMALYRWGGTVQLH